MADAIKIADAWDIIFDSANGIEGQHLKCAKGRWLLDDDEIVTGHDGIKICVVMENGNRWRSFVARPQNRRTEYWPGSERLPIS